MLVCYDEGRPTSQLPSSFPERMKSRRLGSPRERERLRVRDNVPGVGRGVVLGCHDHIILFEVDYVRAYDLTAR